MQESKHTPTPWVFLNSGTAVNEPDGWCIFTPLWPGTPGTHDEKIAEKKANAAFIVRAVNNHEALVEALRAIIKADDTGPMAYEEASFAGYTVSQPVGGTEGKFASIARAALAVLD